MIATVLIPPHAGVLSALGLLASGYALFETTTRRLVLEEARMAEVREVFAQLRRTAALRFAQAGVDGEPLLSASLQMRYVGQAFELDVPVEVDDLASMNADGLGTLFQEAEAMQFHQTRTQCRPIEIVGFRLGASIPSDMPPPAWSPGPGRPDSICTVQENRERFTCRMVSWPHPGVVLPGPLIIDAETSTVFVPSGWNAASDDGENLLMTRAGKAPS